MQSLILEPLVIDGVKALQAFLIERHGIAGAPDRDAGSMLHYASFNAACLGFVLGNGGQRPPLGPILAGLAAANVVNHWASQSSFPRIDAGAGGFMRGIRSFIGQEKLDDHTRALNDQRVVMLSVPGEANATDSIRQEYIMDKVRVYHNALAETEEALQFDSGNPFRISDSALYGDVFTLANRPASTGGAGPTVFALQMYSPHEGCVFEVTAL